MKQKTLNILVVVVCFAVVFSFLANIGIKHIIRAKEKAERQEELSEMYSYEVYSPYIVQNKEYYVYVMCNPQYTLTDVIIEKLSDEYPESLKNKIDDAEKPNVPTRIYMMLPSEELPYGWEES